MKTLPRAIASSLLAGAFVGLAVSGAIAYATPYDPVLAGIHTLLGITVLIAFGFHLANNFRPLLGYLKVRRRILLAVGVPLVVAGIVALGLPPATTIIETGYALRGMGGVTEGSFQVIRTHVGSADTGNAVPVRISVRAGAHYESDPQPLFLGLTYTSTPQMAFWVEDEAGRFLDTLYVTRALSTAGFQSTDLFADEVIRRPEALPVWSHRRGVTYGDGLAIPLREDRDLDGVTAPTPLGHYDLLSAIEGPAEPPRRFRVFMEVNRSYDFNDHWHPGRFPDDPVYSGSGSSGQPSLVYMAEVDLDAGDRYLLLRPIGHGHHSGADGSLNPTLEGFDSALELVGPVLVEIGAGTSPAASTAPGTLAAAH